MSIISGVMSFFSKELPTIGDISFDAKLEGVTSKAVHLTQFPLEVGAPSNDHSILLPDRYLFTGAVSNTPLGFGLDDLGMMGAGLLSSAVGGIGGAAITAVSAYLLAGEESTRAAAAWKSLTALMNLRAPFTLITEYETLENMVIIRLDQRIRPEDEDGLIFVAELQRLRLISMGTIGKGVESADQLLAGDPVEYQGAPMVDSGAASVELIA